MKKMTTTKLLALMTTMLLALGALVSCSSDDDNDGGSAPTPKYESIAAKYNFTSPQAEYKSIEFTASGNYVIVRNESASANAKRNGIVAEKKKPHSLFLNHRSPLTRSESEKTIIVGKYDYKDGEYVLEGIGSIKISVGEDGTYYNVTIVDPSGVETTYSADKALTRITDSEKSNLLCRTWQMTGTLTERISYRGQVIFEWTGTRNDYKDYYEKYNAFWIRYIKEHYPSYYSRISDDYVGVIDEENDFVKQVIFTKSGTMISINGSDEIPNYEDVFWKWIDESKNIIGITWDDITDEKWASNDEDIWSQWQLGFNGNRLTMTDSYKESVREFTGDYNKSEDDYAYEYYESAEFSSVE